MAIIHSSPFPDVEIPDVSLTEYVLRRAVDVPDRVALVDGPTGRSYTFAELRDAVHRLAGGLQARGFGPGSTLALMAPNVPEYALVFHAVAVAGGTVTTINPTYGAEEVRFQLGDARATLLVTVPAFLETARQAIEGTDVPAIHVIGEAEGAEPLTALFGEPIEQVPVDPATSDVVLPYSSGTTGLPKGVMLTHRNLVANLAQCEPVSCPTRTRDSGLAVLPFFHIYGMQILMNGLLSNGCTVSPCPASTSSAPGSSRTTASPTSTPCRR
jgi:acyl-CoA synthetase (AMP-forming)/AMP-acid ligase II